MNAYTDIPQPDEAERRARHLAVCQELIDLGMVLARNAAQRAVDAHEEAQTTPTQETQQPRDPNLAFTRLAACVRHAVALEARIASNAFARPAPASGHDTGPGLDLAEIYDVLQRETLNKALIHLTAEREDRWDLQQTFHDIIDDTFTAFPADPLLAHFTRACVALDIAPDIAALPPGLAGELAPAPPDRWPRPLA